MVRRKIGVACDRETIGWRAARRLAWPRTRGADREKTDAIVVAESVVDVTEMETVVSRDN